MSTCPHCSSSTIRNGHHRNGKQKFMCRSCGKQHVQNPQHRCVPEPLREEIRELLRERISLRGICRYKKVSMPWLLKFIRQIKEELPEDLNARHDSYVLATIAMDEQHSFVGKKANSQWLWLAFGLQTGQVLAMHVGDRNAKSARALLANLPEELKKKRPSTPTNLPSTTKCSPISNTDLTKNGRVLQLTLRDFFVRLDNDVLALSEEPYLSQKSSVITSL